MKVAWKVVNHSYARCPFCHEAVTVEAEKIACDQCMAWHHKECWGELGRCGSCRFEVSEQPPHRQSSEDPQLRRQDNQSFRAICTKYDCQKDALNSVLAGNFGTLCEEHSLAAWKSQRAMFSIFAVVTAALALGCLLSSQQNKGNDLQLAIGAALLSFSGIFVFINSLFKRPV